MSAVLCLGRYGDVINALPIAYKIYCDTGDRPGFIVAEAYADILDGVLYVKPVVFRGNFRHVGIAYDQFIDTFYSIHVAQCYGSSWIPRTDSFCKDAYAQAGFEKHFNLLPLIFDNRDVVREETLVKQYISGTTILVNLTGHSSPLRASDEILMMLQRSWGLMANIVDISQVRCERIYDLLGLYDKADLLITTDTSTLHLAHASPIPSIELIVETPSAWHGSVPKGNCALAVPYSQVIPRMTQIQAAIADIIV